MMPVEEIKRRARERSEQDLMGWTMRLAAEIGQTEEFMLDSVNQVRGLIAQIEVTEDNAWPILVGLTLGLGLESHLDDAARRESAGAQCPGQEPPSPGPKV